MSFEDWLVQKGIDSLPSDAERADAIGAQVFPAPRTAHQAGKEKSLIRRLQEADRLRKQYEAEVPEVVIGERPLDLSRGDDAAYARVVEKRAARRGALL